MEFEYPKFVDFPPYICFCSFWTLGVQFVVVDQPCGSPQTPLGYFIVIFVEYPHFGRYVFFNDCMPISISVGGRKLNI